MLNSSEKSKKKIVILGPTASGKSQLAMDLYDRSPSISIINFDSKQVFKDLRVLTASPGVQEILNYDLKLYNYVDLDRDYNVTDWIKDAKTQVKNAEESKKIPCFVGGTGFFIKSLIEGLDDFPPLDFKIKSEIEDKIRTLGAQLVHHELMMLDPTSALKIHPNDGYRITRAMCIIVQTGQPIGNFYGKTKAPNFEEKDFDIMILLPSRTELHQKISQRFETMIKTGALEEARMILERYPKKFENPKGIFKAHGLPELIAHLLGQSSLKEACEKAILYTKQYTKRQCTFFRHQFKGARFFDNSDALLSSLTNN